MKETIFRKKSLERIASPDKLDDYLKVSSPSVWIVLIALILAVVVAGVWCFFGSMPTTTMAVGVRSQTGTVSFVSAEKGYSISPGMKVQITYGQSSDTLSGKVEKVGSPVQATQAAHNVGADWLAQHMPSSWVCPVTIQLNNGSIPKGAEFSVHIILDERRPIDLLFGR